MKNEKTVVDIDYAEAIVPKSARRGIVTMFMIMLGFTFFSASMWVGQQLADGLDFQGFVVSMIVGGVILSLYTGLLGYVGAETGMSLDLLARKAFGTKGSYLPSAMISFTQIGWFGVGIAMFAIPVANELLGGSKTAEWALVIVAGICMTASAYFGIKSLTIVSYIAVPMVAVLGTVATVLAVWLYWNFCGWLNILNCTLPPVGIILVLGYFLNKEKYQDVEVSETVNWFAVLGVVLGAVVANLVHWGIASINGMVVAAVCYLIGRAVEKK